MPYVKEPPPTGASRDELVRYYDGELEKLQTEFERSDAGLEALSIIGVIAQWFWQDAFPGEPAVGHISADSNIMDTITQLNVHFTDTQGRDIQQALKTSTIEPGDLLGLINVSGLGAGNYIVNAPVVFFANHIEIPVDTFQGQSGNPTDDDVVEMRWEFNTHAPQVTP